MIDCHAHLADASFDGDRADVIERARQAGVRAILCVSEGLEDADRVLEVAAQFSVVRPCLGLHPERADLTAADTLCAQIRDNRHSLTAIGEVGLDYWLAKEEGERHLQREVLSRFIALSIELALPLNIHSRSAGHHTIALLRETGATRVLMHAFDGRAHFALAGVEAGFDFSVPPSIVRSPQKQKLVSRLPLTSLLLETDSPVLGPDKQARNEPANVRIAAVAIAEIKGVSVEEVDEVTTRNAERLFGCI
jgi:TatD DNase family protein